MNASPPSWRRRWLCRLVPVLVVLAALIPGRGWLLATAARWLDVAESPRPVDAVMVLGGGAETRPFAAAALVRAGLARRVLTPTVRLSPGSEDGLSPPEHEVIRRVLRHRGVAEEDIVSLPGEVASTRDEARSLGRFLDAEPDATVAVVTHGYHTRRARMLFRHELGGRMARVHFLSVPTDHFGPDDWWRHEEGFHCYLTEFFKLAYYGLREDRSCQAVVLALAGLFVAVLLMRRFRRRAAVPEA